MPSFATQMLGATGRPAASTPYPHVPDEHSALDEQMHCCPLAVPLGRHAPAVMPCSSVQQPLAAGPWLDVEQDCAQMRVPVPSSTHTEPESQQSAPQMGRPSEQVPPPELPPEPLPELAPLPLPPLLPIPLPLPPPLPLLPPPLLLPPLPPLPPLLLAPPLPPPPLLLLPPELLLLPPGPTLGVPLQAARGPSAMTDNTANLLAKRAREPLGARTVGTRLGLYDRCKVMVRSIQGDAEWVVKHRVFRSVEIVLRPRARQRKNRSAAMKFLNATFCFVVVSAVLGWPGGYRRRPPQWRERADLSQPASTPLHVFILYANPVAVSFRSDAA